MQIVQVVTCLNNYIVGLSFCIWLLTKRVVHGLVFTQDVEFIQLMQYKVKHHLCYDPQIFTFKCEVLHLLFI